ncbi:MAG: Gfo/Idh/MocA family oxidoreductase [Bacteroidetes bacterium]|jgi:predicted dehydrogenase|nr:Gfo/Idh/MocA family oxidoreductase [Bacteroidota bacterium]
MDKSRREFIKKSGLGAAGVTLGAYHLSAAASAKNILGANDHVNFAVVGLNGRGKALVSAIIDAKNASVGYVCDVDSRVLEESAAMVEKYTGKTPKAVKDYRKLLENDDLDAVAIATPEHWHAPMTVMAAQAGKHVYIEKPCSHNPREGELLVETMKKYKPLIQMGDQQRSAPHTIEAINDIHNGIIGEAYYGKAFYANNRGSIGYGKVVPVPEWLDWELWQGPAPREQYRDNIVHYNWHWFWNWGTGEINNNAIHELDICRWALKVDYPDKVSSNGGRYHFNDDWEFYDTQIANFEFSDNKIISWEGKSCNPMQFYGMSRGVSIHGTKGTVVMDRNIYKLYDMDNNLVKERKAEGQSATINISGSGPLDVLHFNNLIDGIREGAKLNSPIDEGVISNLYCHLGNISQEVGRTLYIDNTTGRIRNDGQAMQMWSREYEPGWELKV